MLVCLTHSYTQMQIEPTHSLTLSPLSSSPCPPKYQFTMWKHERTQELSLTELCFALMRVCLITLTRLRLRLSYPTVVSAGPNVVKCVQLTHSKSHGCPVGGTIQGGRGSKTDRNVQEEKKHWCKECLRVGIKSNVVFKSANHSM